MRCGLFFFQCSDDLRDLHSFPTRRSSDLKDFWITKTVSTVESNNRSATPTYGEAKYRSEEHTSELQSRFDLVCRLLLEKKKGYSHPHRTSCAHPLAPRNV